MVILYYDMPAIDLGVELLEAEAHWQTFFLNVCILSLNVSKGLLANAMGLPLCIRTAPSLYSLASVSNMTGLDLS